MRHAIAQAHLAHADLVTAVGRPLYFVLMRRALHAGGWRCAIGMNFALALAMRTRAARDACPRRSRCVRNGMSGVGTSPIPILEAKECIRPQPAITGLARFSSLYIMTVTGYIYR